MSRNSLRDEPESNPLVSIIVRTVGKKPTLLQLAVDSIFDQSYPNIEIVLVAREGTSILASLNRLGNQQQFPIIYQEIGAENRSVAGNAGLSAATGKYVMFLDDDDFLFDNHVATLVAGLESHPGHNLAYCKAYPEMCSGLKDDLALFPVRQLPIGPHPYSKARLWFANEMAIQAVMFDRLLFRTAGGMNENLTILEDWELWLRYSNETEFLSLDIATSVFRIPRETKAIVDRASEHAKGEPAFLEAVRELRGTFGLEGFGKIQDAAMARIGIRCALAIIIAKLRSHIRNFIYENYKRTKLLLENQKKRNPFRR